MNNRSVAAGLSLLAGALLLVLPGIGHAGTVGYLEMCGDNQVRHAIAITTAGHTPVAVTTPNAETLAGLDALSVTNCDNEGFSSSYTSHLAAITAAVNGGMVLIVHDRAVTGASGILPGGSGLNVVRNTDSGDADIDFPAGSPIITGPGGTLTNTSLDGGNSSTHGYVVQTSLPAGGTVLATRPTGGGGGEGEGGFTSCAAEGYTGTKLNWCRQICEIEQSPGVLETWIHRWVNRYREDPPCAGSEPVGETQGATVQYPYGEGRVVYSTIPLDYYLVPSTEPLNITMGNVYLPNVIGWALPPPQGD